MEVNNVSFKKKTNTAMARKQGGEAYFIKKGQLRTPACGGHAARDTLFLHSPKKRLYGADAAAGTNIPAIGY